MKNNMVKYPHLKDKNADKRFKTDFETVKTILKMRDVDGHTIQYIADVLKLSYHTVYYKYMEMTDPVAYKKRKESRRLAQETYIKNNPHRKNVKTHLLRIRERQLELNKDELINYDRTRSLDYYRKNKEIINPKRNLRRRMQNKIKKAPQHDLQ